MFELFNFETCLTSSNRITLIVWLQLSLLGLSPVNSEIKFSQIKVGLHYLEVIGSGLITLAESHPYQEIKHFSLPLSE